MSEERNTLWIFWPFTALWRLLTWILELTGRLVAAILGMVFMAVGTILSLTVVGAFIGVPLFVFGMLLMLRGLF